MTGREVVESAFLHKRATRLPVALVAGGEWYVHQAGRTFAQIKNDPEQIAAVFVDAYRRLGQDLIWTGAGFLNYPAHFLGSPIEDDTSDTPKLTETVIKNLDDADALDFRNVFENKTCRAIISSHHLIAEAIGKETIVMPTLWGPMTTAARILGAEAVMMASFENPEKLFRLIEFCTEYIWAMGEPMLDHPDVTGMNISDPVASADMISPALFRQYVTPCLKDLVRRIKGSGKHASIHICGDSTPLLDEILDIAPTCFSLESKVDLEVAGEKLGGKICVLGNLSPTGNFLSGTPESVIQEGKDCIKRWGDAPGFILTVGCDFPKKVPFENVKALMSLKSYH
jgi:uroporphyrinogen decarboxylase